MRTTLNVTCFVLVIALVLACKTNPARGSKNISSFQLPSSQESDAIQQTAKRYENAVFLIDGREAVGTAFVISRKSRLLVTAGHVAQYLSPNRDFAVMAGTGIRYRIGRIWVHPDIVGTKENANAGSTDVAVIQLTNEGPALPAEWVLLGRGLSTHSAIGYAIGVTGFCGIGHAGYRRGERIRSHTMPGVVLQSGNVATDSEESMLETIDHNAPIWRGGSGSPVFISSGGVGIVIGVNSGRSWPVDDEGRTAARCVGIGSNAIWDLCMRLWGTSALPDQQKIDIGILSLDSEAIKKRENQRTYSVPNETNSLFFEAREHREAGEYDAALGKLNSALKLAPRWCALYNELSLTYLARAEQRPHMASRDVSSAWTSAHQALQLCAGFEHHLTFGRATVALSAQKRNPGLARNVVVFFDPLLERGGHNSHERSIVKSIHAEASQRIGRQR